MLDRVYIPRSKFPDDIEWADAYDWYYGTWDSETSLYVNSMNNLAKPMRRIKLIHLTFSSREPPSKKKTSKKKTSKKKTSKKTKTTTRAYWERSARPTSFHSGIPVRGGHSI